VIEVDYSWGRVPCQHSSSIVEEVYLPCSLESVGDRFLYGSEVQSVDLSMTKLTAVGDEFLAYTPLLSWTSRSLATKHEEMVLNLSRNSR
jgi:hypothetical protein